MLLSLDQPPWSFPVKQLQFSNYPLLTTAGICHGALCLIPGLGILAPQQSHYPLWNTLQDFAAAEASPLPGFPGLCQIFL